MRAAISSWISSTAAGHQVGGTLASGEAEVAVRGLVDDPVDGGNATADVHEVSLGDAGQAFGDECGGGDGRGLGCLVYCPALPAAFGDQERLGVLAGPDGSAVAADAVAAHGQAGADEVARALAGDHESFLPQPG
jgi:hypothetical protein